MATVNKTIGTNARDYSTFTLWESDDGGGDGLGNDDCTGNAYNDSIFSEAYTINFSALSIVLTAASGEQHNGIAGTGVRIVAGSVSVNTTIAVTVSWLEVDGDGANIAAAWCSYIENTKIFNMIFHNLDGNRVAISLMVELRRNSTLLNSIVYNNNNIGTGDTVGINIKPSGFHVDLLNVTVFDISHPTADSHGVLLSYDSAHDVKNVISVDSNDGASGKDFRFVGTATDSETNLSSDDSADDAGGSGHLIGETAANQFVSTSPVNLHLKTGADAINAGTDLGVTPSGVEIDIDGWNRDSDTPSRDPWDMGAHEFEPVAIGGILIHPGISGGMQLIAGGIRG